ncbi:MAG: hypothetical protein ABW321_22175 [Polyangiales bacterium]
MGFLDRLFGSTPAQNPPRSAAAAPAPGGNADEQAIARYRYLLRTAPPEAIEQAHAEAFAQLTPEQRTEVLRQLSAELPGSERAGAQQDDPQGLARLATRAELRQPGVLEKLFGARGVGAPGMAPGGVGLGGMMAGSLLSSIAGTFIGSAIAHQFLGGFDHSPEAGHHLADNDARDDNHDDQNAGDNNDRDDSEYAENSDHPDQDDAQYDDGGDFGDDDFGSDDFDV